MSHNSLYQSKFSTSIMQLKPSSIRELLKLLSNPEFISLAGGALETNHLPVDLVRKYALEALDSRGHSILQYGQTEGLPRLREALVPYLGERGIIAEMDEIMITTGGQNAIDAVTKTFINPGDSIILEEPSFLASIKAFKLLNAKLIALKLGTHGLELTQLGNALTAQTKFIYIIPNYQNPTGLSWSLENRKALAQFAIEKNLLIVEDDPYHHLNYNGEKLPTIYSLAPRNTIYTSSFSKLVSPGMRVGYVVAAKEIIGKLTLARQVNDVHTNNLAQEIVLKMLEDKTFPDLERIMITSYSEKLANVLEILEKELPDDVEFTKPTGGMFLWITLPSRIDFAKLNKELLARKVAVVPGDDFFSSEVRTNSFRLNFTQPTLDRLQSGVAIICDTIKNYPDY